MVHKGPADNAQQWAAVLSAGSALRVFGKLSLGSRDEDRTGPVQCPRLYNEVINNTGICLFIFFLASKFRHQKRKVDAVYYYMRNLMCPNPITSARENLATLFDEIRKKVGLPAILTFNCFINPLTIWSIVVFTPKPTNQRSTRCWWVIWERSAYGVLIIGISIRALMFP